MTNFKKAGVLAVLVAMASCHALADGGRGYPQHRRPQIRQSHSDWVAPLLFLGLAGVVLSAAANRPSEPVPTYVAPPPAYGPPNYGQPTYVPPAVTYVEPAATAPAPPAAPANTWYFCQSVGKYYPYTQYCPEGWQLVAAPQQQ